MRRAIRVDQTLDTPLLVEKATGGFVHAAAIHIVSTLHAALLAGQAHLAGGGAIGVIEALDTARLRQLAARALDRACIGHDTLDALAARHVAPRERAGAIRVRHTVHAQAEPGLAVLRSGTDLGRIRRVGITGQRASAGLGVTEERRRAGAAVVAGYARATGVRYAVGLLGRRRRRLGFVGGARRRPRASVVARPRPQLVKQIDVLRLTPDGDAEHPRHRSSRPHQRAPDASPLASFTAYPSGNSRR